jgi:hypothetical protein
LNHTRINDAGLRAFVGCNASHYLEVKGTGVTKSGVAALNALNRRIAILVE